MDNRDNFLDYHWVKRFYDKVVEKLGLQAVEAFVTEMEEEAEAEYQERRRKTLASGCWVEIGKGIYISRLAKKSDESNKL